MAEKMRARVIRVRVDRREATVATGAAIGDSVVYVKDAGDLAAPGTVQANDDAGTLLDYTAVTLVEDDDPTDLDSPDSITLAAPLTVAIDAGTTLWVYEAPDGADGPDDPRVAEVIAFCIPEDDEDAAETGEPIRAVVPQEKQDDLQPGRMAGDGVPVVLEWDDETDEWFVARFRGKGSRAMRFVHDTFTLAAGGPQSLFLTATPRPNSEHVYANGLELLEGIDWSRSESVVSLLVTMDPQPRKGYKIDVRYAKANAATSTDTPITTLVPFKSSGWSYKAIGRTDSTDYSAAGFDYSAWPVGSAAFGSGPVARQPWAPSTAWAIDGRIWLRRDIPKGSDYTITGRVEDTVEVWWNGNFVGTFVNGNLFPSREWSFTIPPEYVTEGVQSLAIRATDEAGGDATDAAFIDAQVRGKATT